MTILRTRLDLQQLMAKVGNKTAGEVRVMSTKTSKVTTIIQQGSGTFYGIAVDTIRNKLYWTSSYKIYRSELNGIGLRTVLDTNRCKFLPFFVYLRI